MNGIQKIEGVKAGLGGGFSYCELGETLFDASGQLCEERVGFADLARHVYFTETGQPLPPDARLNSPLVGTHENTAVYLLYNGIMEDMDPEGGNILTPQTLGILPKHDGPRVIYANGVRISPEGLQQQNIIFRQTPYEIKVN